MLPLLPLASNVRSAGLRFVSALAKGSAAAAPSPLGRAALHGRAASRRALTTSSAKSRFLPNAARTEGLVSAPAAKPSSASSAVLSRLPVLGAVPARHFSDRFDFDNKRGSAPRETERRSDRGLRSVVNEDDYMREQPRQMDSLSPAVQQHMMKVYTTMAGAVGTAGAGSLLFMLTPLGAMSPFIPILGSFVPLFGFMYMNNRRDQFSVQTRTAAVMSYAGLSGMGMAPLIGAAMAINPMIVAGSLGITAGLFVAMSALALASSRRSMLRLGAPLGGGLLMMILCSLGAMLLGPGHALYPLLHSVWTYGGIAIFSGFISYDTQNMIAAKEAGDDDHLSAVLNMFMNLSGIFRHLLAIFISRD